MSAKGVDTPAAFDEKSEEGLREYASPQGLVHDSIHKHVEGEIQLVDKKGALRLVPTPTKSPRDPLNFSKLRKFGILVTVCFFSINALAIVGGFGAILGSFIPIYIPQGVPPNKIARLLTWPSLFTGIANFLFIPLALVFGRRPIFLGASCLLIGSSVWAAHSGASFEQHLAARILQGFAAGATESLLPLILTDCSFIHERSWYFGVYWTMQSILTAVLNASSSYIAVNLGWPWYYWIFTILATIGTVMIIFLLPETKFDRPAFMIDGQMARIDGYGNMVILSDDEAAEAAAAANDAEADIGSNDKSFTFASSLGFVKPESGGIQTIVKSYFDIFRSLLDPSIIWALGASSVALGINIAVSLSFGHLLTDFYGWKPENTGLIYLGALPACALSFLFSGWGGDKINLWLAKRNGGTHIAEHRLPSLILPTIIGLAAGLMYGFCADKPNSVHWFAIVFSFNALTFWFVAVLIATTTYAVEAMTHHAGAALVMVVGGKNILSFGMATAIVPLANSGRYAYGNGILTGVNAGWFLLGVPVYFFMPAFRRWRASKIGGK